MSDQTASFGDIAQKLARNPLGIIALFIVLVYGFAALVTGFSSSFTANEKLPLIYFMIIFPVLVLGVFGWLVSRHSNKLFAPSDFRTRITTSEL
jgi:cytochrome c oxidase subunit IV